MVIFNPANSLAFFHVLAGEFAAILAPKAEPAARVETLMQQAFAHFAINVARESSAAQRLACRGGCAACCALRVTATAPEVFVIAAHLRAIDAAMPALGYILRQRIAAAASAPAGSDAAYLALGRPCVFIVDGHCIIYELRPLACRGHASFDEAACLAPIEGHCIDVPISEPHLLLRAYVQNALQSALRDAGLAWAIHEFLPALTLALDADALAAWGRGEDPLAASRAADVSLVEMAAGFDEIKALAGRALA